MDGTLNPFESPTGEIDVQTFDLVILYAKPLYAVLWGILDNGHAENILYRLRPVRSTEKGLLMKRING